MSRIPGGLFSFPPVHTTSIALDVSVQLVAVVGQAKNRVRLEVVEMSA